ncbi:hypothetical protein ACHAWX_002489, partial [Stephanocyclus meneghinianus]
MTPIGSSAPVDGVSAKRGCPKIPTIIFDVDDTLYDVGTGFTAHRNTDGATAFMVDKLHFHSKEEAQILRNEYFTKYHSTAKLVLEKVGVLPEECIMVEDSMKNIRVAKSLGMKTILVVGKGRKRENRIAEYLARADDAEATKAGDIPDETDPAVD